MSKKELPIKDGQNLLLYDPGTIDPKTKEILFYRHISPRSLREEIEKIIPKVKKILEGTRGAAFIDIDNFPAETHSSIEIPVDTTKRTLSHRSLVGFRAKDASKEPVDIIAGDLAEKFSGLKFDLEKERKMIQAVRKMYQKRLDLKCCSRARTIMEPKIQLARKWLEESKNEYRITKTVWETYAVIKTFCRENGKNNCSEAFVYKIIYNLCGVFGIKKPSCPETLQRRIARILNSVSKIQERKQVEIKSTGAGFVGPEGEYYPPPLKMKALQFKSNTGNKVSHFLHKRIMIRECALIDIL